MKTNGLINGGIGDICKTVSDGCVIWDIRLSIYRNLLASQQ